MSAPQQSPDVLPQPLQPARPPVPPQLQIREPGTTPDVVTPAALAGAPMSRQDIEMLRARRAELSDQLESATGRRRALAEQVRRADGVNKAGLEARLTVLDQRIVRIESEIDQIGQQLASPQAARFAETRPPMEFGPRFENVQVEPIAITFTLFVLAPIALTLSRLIWKRGSRPTAPSALPADSAERLERIEQAVDAIAIEVERVSEGQRFVTRLLAERGGAPLAAGAQEMEPVRVPAAEPSRVR